MRTPVTSASFLTATFAVVMRRLYSFTTCSRRHVVTLNALHNATKGHKAACLCAQQLPLALWSLAKERARSCCRAVHHAGRWLPAAAGRAERAVRTVWTYAHMHTRARAHLALQVVCLDDPDG